MESFMNLSLIITLALPFLGVLLILIIPRDNEPSIRQIGIFFALGTLILTAIIWWNVVPYAGTLDDANPTTFNRPWIGGAGGDPEITVDFHLGVDGLSAPMLFLTALLTTLSLFYSARTIKRRVKEYTLLFLVLEACTLGVFMSLDLILFYVFWQISLVPMFLLIGVWGGERRQYAALKFFLYTMAGSVAMLLAIIALFFWGGQELGTPTFDITALAQANLFSGRMVDVNVDDIGVIAAFWAFFVAFAIKVPAFPFHTWLPDAHTEAPTAGSVILAGVLLKLGGYGMIRIALPIFPEQFHYFVTTIPIIPILAVIGIAYGAMVCLAQWDFKRLIAYSSVAHMGYVVLGVCGAAAGVGQLDDALFSAAAASGINGAAFQLFSHGIITGGMFFLVGMLYERAHQRDLRRFGGLADQAPHYYGLTLVTGLALLGLPGLAGFWSELLVYRSTIKTIPIFALIGGLGVIFTAAYVLWKIVQHVFLGELDREKWGQLPDLTWWEKVTIWPLVLIAVVLGFYPAPLLDTINAAITTLITGLQSLP